MMQWKVAEMLHQPAKEGLSVKQFLLTHGR